MDMHSGSPFPRFVSFLFLFTWISDGREHANEEREGVAHRGHDRPLGEDLRKELGEDGVEDQRPPADEEDSRDAAQQDVGPLPASIHLLMLAWRPGIHLEKVIIQAGSVA